MTSSLLPHQPAALAIPGAFLLGIALVVELFAPRQSKLDLGPATLVEIEFERYKRHALALDGADQLFDLTLVQQQLARPLRRMVEAIGLQIFGNIGIDQPDLAVAGVGIRFCDCRLALAQRFDLGAGQRDAGLEGLIDKIIEACFAIVGDNAELSFILGRHHYRLCRPRPLSSSSAHRGFRPATALPETVRTAPAAPPESSAC